MVLDEERLIELRVKLATSKQLLTYEKEVREDRRWQFERWDKNSAALILQHETEIADLEAELEKAKA